MERFKFCLCYLLTYTDATTEFSMCPPLSVLASCCHHIQPPPAGAYAAACLDQDSWAQGGSRLFSINTLLPPQSLAIKKPTSN